MLQLHQDAPFRRGDGWAVFRAEDGEARLTEVEIGQRNDLTVEITSGLKEGQQVVLDPGDRIDDGVGMAPRG